jgi:heme exporter protein C
LHQGSTIRLLGPSHIDASMVWPLLTMMAATKLYYVASLFARVRADFIAAESGKAWVRDIALGKAQKGAA